MDLLNNNRDKLVTKPEMEQVQQEKTEYTLLGTYLRRRGTFVFGWDSIKQEVFSIDVQYSSTIHIKRDEFGKLYAVDLEFEKCFVDSRFIYFEAISLKHAKERVQKWKSGKIKELVNMRKYNPELREQLKWWK